VSQEKRTPLITNSNQVYFARLLHYESQGLLLRGDPSKIPGNAVAWDVWSQ
jgi:hypothetical protein